MGIGLNNLLEELKAYNPKLFLSQEAGITFKGVKLVEHKQLLFDPEYLYVGTDLQLLDTISLDDGVIHILCVVHGPEVNIAHENAGVNLIVISDKPDMPAIFNKLQNAFLKQQQMGLKHAELFDALMQGRSIQQILDIGYKLLGNPINLCDVSFKTLFYSSYKEMDDPYWNEFVTKGYLSYDTVSILRIQKVVELVENSSSPIYFSKEKYDVPRFISKIVADHKTVGYTSILESEKPFEEGDVNLFTLLCSFISLEMQKSRFIQNSKGYLYESFITEMLEGKEVEPGIVNDRIKYLDLNLKENLYVLTIHPAGSKSVDKAPIQYLRNLFEQIVRGSKSVIYNDTIVLLISRSREMTPQQIDIRNLADFLKKNKLIGGMSRCFHHLSDLQKYYPQSVKSMEYGSILSGKKPLYFYEDYVLYHLFDIRDSKEQLTNFCHASIFGLIEYDRSHHTNYMETLHIYLKNEKKIIETANTLQIHRNTLSSRIEAIEEILNINLDDVDTTLHLHLTFKILKFARAKGKV